MASKWIASLAGAALMVTSAAAQEYEDDEYMPLEYQVAQARGGCERAVQQAIEMTGGELLSVRPTGNGRQVCAVTVLVTNAKGRPKKVRLRIPMD